MHDAGAMAFHRSGTDVEDFCNLPAGLARHDQHHDFMLAFGEQCQFGRDGL